MIDCQPFIQLLKDLIAQPSFSREEDKTADLIQQFLENRDIPTVRKGNNIWAKSKNYTEGLPNLLLNSHHDTVKPVAGWTRNPFSPDVVDGKLYGLGSNDAGASLVSLIANFCYFYDKSLPFNLLVLASAEEEISGKNGVETILPDLPPPSVGIVGEPTQMQMAVAEKGLMVVDGIARGKAGHAARNEGVNAIYKALQDIEMIRQYDFEKKSDFLGAVKMSVTQIQAGTQHNVVPDECRFVIDIRTNECYSNREVYDIIQAHVKSELLPRSFRLNSSKIALNHPLVLRGLELGLSYYGSPTLSDQALMSFPTLKMGVGDSARSHTADEYIYIKEIEEGIETYRQMIGGIKL
ncbi:MAG: M20 family metallo-hydrolase [Saprospiraceae bacterium]|nr:M20 family metallo-hydrolase [Saprospiraceae bacterium]